MLTRLLVRLGLAGPKIKFKRLKMAMIDLETFDLESTSAFYAIGARIFTFGERISARTLVGPGDKFNVKCPDFLQYIHPDILNDKRFTSSRKTLEWTMEHNAVEYERALRFGTSIEVALENLNSWLLVHDPRYVCANSPSFDIAILRHAFKVHELNLAIPFRDEFDVRTITSMRSLVGLERYAARTTERLHSPLDDCTLQINNIHGLVRYIETGQRD